ncbi:hypothetical protein ACLB2K_054732 [Fragaria x ananassa]
MEKQTAVFVDHYRVLGLPSGKEGSKLEDEQIKKAYRAKVLQLQLNDLSSKAKFQRLKSSYAILMDPKSRKQFDDTCPRELVLTKDQQNILLGLCYLVFVASPATAFPAARTKLASVATILCYHLAFRRTPSQASTNNQEPKSQEGSYMRSAFKSFLDGFLEQSLLDGFLEQLRTYEAFDYDFCYL